MICVLTDKVELKDQTDAIRTATYDGEKHSRRCLFC